MDKLAPYTIGLAPDGSKCAYLGETVDARDFIFEGVAYRFSRNWRGCNDVYEGLVLEISHKGVEFGAICDHSVDRFQSQFGKQVFVRWGELEKLIETTCLDIPRSPWQQCGGRSMKQSQFTVNQPV